MCGVEMKYEIKESAALSELASIAEGIVNELADELEVKRPLPVSRKLYVEGKTLILAKTLQEEYKKVLLQMSRVGEVLDDELTRLPEIERESYSKELSLAMEMLKSGIDSDDLEKAGSLQSLLKLRNETLLWIYRLGAQRFEEKKFDEALSFFMVLVALNSRVCDYWIALGTTQQALLLDADALISFSLAAVLDPEYAMPKCHSAEIYLRLGRFDEASLEIEALAEIIQKKNLDSLKSYLECLQNKLVNRQSS